MFAPDFILSAKRINVADVKAGTGTVHFELLNLRAPLTVKYLQFKLVRASCPAPLLPFWASDPDCDPTPGP